jgi:predicted phosphodiesterase
MKTAIISDLHLGKAAGHDLLRRPDISAQLLAKLTEADRLILLGDAVELRESPVADALHAARPFFEELGDAMAGKPIVLVPGNHDYQLALPLLDGHRLNGGRPLNSDEHFDAHATKNAGGLLGTFAKWLEPAQTELRYPGIWLRDDVYATHGHYMDWHGTVPTIERLAIGLARRVTGHKNHEQPETGLTPDDYERSINPVYSLAYALAQSASPGRQLAGGGRSVDMWERLNGTRPGARARAEAAFAGIAIPTAVAALNRLGLGPLKPDLSAVELRRAGLRSIAAVVAALELDAAHVIFGHTHRSGPWDGDDVTDWKLGNGGQLWNSGSWIHEVAFTGPRPHESPYYPSVICWVDDEPGSVPRLERTLQELPAD